VPPAHLDVHAVSSSDEPDGTTPSLYWFAAGTAHDINNLLMVVVGCAELALTDATLQPATRQQVRDIVSAGERAGLLTRQLLTGGRPSTASAAVVDATLVLQEAEALISRLVGPRVRLVLSAAAPCPVRASASQLEQIVVNLALNARDAMPGGGELTISVDPGRPTDAMRAAASPPPRASISVADTGAGIDPAIRDRMFEAFVTTRPGHGLGLGLAVVRATVAQLGGDIHMTTAPGSGTTFTVDLPRATTT